MSRLLVRILLLTSLGTVFSMAQRSHAEANESTPSLDADALVSQVIARCRPWLRQPGPELKSLKYTYHLNGDKRVVEIAAAADPVRRAFWQGATLSLGLHALAKSPEKFTAAAERIAGDADDPQPFIRLTLRPKAQADPFRIEVGNGIEGSWYGYYIHAFDEFQIDLDPETLLPRRETHAFSHYAFSDWQEVQPGAWIPQKVVASRNGYEYRMNFAWQGDAAWLLTHAETLHDGRLRPVARVSDVQVNDSAVTVALSAEQQRLDAARRVVRDMLDRNAAWLAPKPAFDSLQYSFHIEPQEVTETCVVRRDGFTLVEVTGDGQGKMEGQLGDRKIVTAADEFANARRDDLRANVRDRSPDAPEPNDALQLRRYALIGCQFDLPLFELGRTLDNAMVEVKEGEWQGVPCFVATITPPGRSHPLGCGVMLGFTSWSYIHHLYAESETIFIDKERLVPLHETFIESRDGRRFEIDFKNYQPLAEEGDRLAPLQIDISSKDYFTCQYEFQLIGGKQWLIRSAESWFKADEKSRGVVSDVRIDEPSPAADAALRQVAAFQEVFAVDSAASAAEPHATQTVDTLPFKLGQPRTIGAAEVLFTLNGKQQLVLRATRRADAESPGDRVTVLLLDKQDRLLQAGSVEFTGTEAEQTAEISFGGSYALRNVARYAIAGLGNVATLPDAEPRSLHTFALVADKPTPIRGVADPSGKTRVVDAMLQRDADGDLVATLGVVSRDGMQQFEVDASLAMFDQAGKLLAAASKSDSITVKSDLYAGEWTLAFPASVNRADVAAMAVGVSRGQTTSMPMGSMWAALMDFDGPFGVDELLGAADEGCWPAGLEALQRELSESLSHGLFGRDHDWREKDSRHEPPVKLLAPHVANLLRIVAASREPKTLAAAIRFLGYADDPRAVEAIRPLRQHDNEAVRDAAAVALLMLRDDAQLPAVEAILSREPAKDPDESYRANYELRRDALLALASCRSAQSIPLAGKRLLALVDGSEKIRNEGGGSHLNRAGYEAEQLAQLLGRVQDERYLPILEAALQRAEQHDGDNPPAEAELLTAILNYGPAARHCLESLVRAGNSSAVNAVADSKDDFYVAAVGSLLQTSDDLNAWDPAIGYLWNQQSPASLAALQQAFDRGVPAGERQASIQLELATALAALGDARGLPLAFDLLVKLAEPGVAPDDAKAKRQWEKSRDDRRRDVLRVFSRAATDDVAALLAERASNADAPARLAIMQLLGQSHSIPAALRPALEEWAADKISTEVSQQAERLLLRLRE
ncbi:HEAT repeat domain-containing protein [Lacipirellula parvula]|uniref:HEAT repeat protein n=1 Tax=Lacipirellula parvula TaxID=2650471 RepID=A0A5K7XB19_9BACT|nr:HEAT repeat domain-containing protein [Lacipirellula parvula]BBO33142.1 hypothetical protein PLANPX_2754 [Lacipirellula parvula]